MSIDVEKLLRHEAFQVLEPERAEAFKSLVQKLQGKGSAEAMTLILSFAASMPKGRELLPEERDAMMQAILESMSAEEKQKFKSVLKMLETMKK